MTNLKPNGRLVILSGPSCVGKSPLLKALGRFFPELHQQLRQLVLHNSRSPRPGERDGVDYHFRTRDQMEALRSNPRFAVLDVRGDLQALDLEDLTSNLAKGEGLLFEGNPYVARLLLDYPGLTDVPRLSIFLTPLSRIEISYLKAPERHTSLADFVTDVMRRKLLRRTRRQKTELSLPDLENIERRAGCAFGELREAWHFDHVIPNHDGEDSDNWDAFYHPLGDARLTLLAVVDLLNGTTPALAEKWDKELLVQHYRQ